MRSGGAAVADLAVLVVSAQDGICEQTGESIGCLDDLALPAVVALTKMDLVPEAQREQVRHFYCYFTVTLV
jgi:translation initiation factor IF-2